METKRKVVEVTYVDGTSPDFDETKLEWGNLYLIKKSEDGTNGYIYYHGNHYGFSANCGKY